jgi:hypothetical protein
VKRLVAFAVCAGLAAAGGVGSALGATGSVSLMTSPPLYPAFSPSVHDYVVRCADESVSVQVATPAGMPVSVAGRPPEEGDFATSVPLHAGEAFAVRTQRARGYVVRCLPSDFPGYSFTRSQPVAPGLFAVSPALGAAEDEDANYVAIFDTFGVPVWWYHADTPAMNAELLPDGTIAWGRYYEGGFATDPASGYEIHRLDGTLLSTRQTSGAPTDFHELTQLPNGDYFLGAYEPRDHVDLTKLGGPSDATVLDAVVEKFNAIGEPLWRWKSSDHIALKETEPVWCCERKGASRLADGREAFDILHMNSIDATGDDVIVSMRAADAVYRISTKTGQILWKLGGTLRLRSLRVLDDPLELGGGGDHHDARVLPDGTVSVFENNISLGLTSRLARYRIDAKRRTATLVQSIDSGLYAACCGSARPFGEGWLIDWGAQPVVDGYDASGRRAFELRFDSRIFSYRAVPVTGVRVFRLRAAMNRMYATR